MKIHIHPKNLYDLHNQEYQTKLYLLHGEAPFTDDQEDRIYTREEKLKALLEAKRVTKNGGPIFVAYVMNEYSIITYCFKQNKILECLKNGTLSPDFKALTTEDDLYCYTRLEDMNVLNNKADLERIKIFAPDGAADYIRRELNALSEEAFEQFIKYQTSVAERPELLGASSHTVDVLRVNK